MDIRHITPAYAVSPQIDPTDLPAIAAAGFTCVISNRPDEEVPSSHQAHAMQIATEAAGLEFVHIPVTHQGLTSDLVAQQKAAIAEATGPVLAYCASGTRSSIVWSLAQAGDMATDDIIKATQSAGYELGGMRGQLDLLAKQT
ncbi:MAG: TIGR01244 family phosphatase [Yoonia sp.]|nr:TIGR01244 family phosphatase [Yoonia sp.]